MGSKDWVTDEMFTTAVSELLAEVQGFIPSPATVLEVCQVLNDEQKGREAGEILALPAPRDPAAVTLAGGPPAGFRLTRDWWDEQVEQGRARQRERNAVFAAHRMAAEEARRLAEVPDSAAAELVEIPPWTDADEAALRKEHPHLRLIVPEHTLMKDYR